MEAKRFRFKPEVYLTDGWGCPDRTPVIGIPFYLADPRLARLEEEQTGEVEDPRTIMMLLRHEAGHAVNYAYRLWRRPSWGEIFGPFTKPYRDSFRPDRMSRHYVRHIAVYPYGRTYAQKHPDEDFAETFAVWLTPAVLVAAALPQLAGHQEAPLRRPADEGHPAGASPKAAAAAACVPSTG